jgi:hypothetical protein
MKNLYELFHRDEEAWWSVNELPQAIRRFGFLTRIALKHLRKSVALQRRLLILSAIYDYSPRGGRVAVGSILQVRLGKDWWKRNEKKAEIVQVKKRNTPGQIPAYSAQLDSLRP